MPMKDNLNQHDPIEVSGVALKGFIENVDRWPRNHQEAKCLLGKPSDQMFKEWQQNQKAQETISEEIFERTSYVMDIHKALRTIFEDRQRADTWIKKPNEYFCGDSALDVILVGRLKEARQYIDYQCQI